MKENLKLAMVLAIIVGISTALLAFTYAITKGPIENTRFQNEMDAMKAIMPIAKDFEEIKIESPESYNGILKISKATDGNDIVGYIFMITTKGYGGNLKFLAGLDKDSKLTGMKVLEHSETPGLGAVSTTEEFQSQFKGKSTENGINYVKGTEPKEGEISAITGATITTKAITKGVNEAIDYYNKFLKKGV